MLSFAELPARAETTLVNADVVHFLAYGPEDRCINGAAEACAAVALANAADLVEVMAIGEKVGKAMGERANSSDPDGDEISFIRRYASTVSYLNIRSII